MSPASNILVSYPVVQNGIMPWIAAGLVIVIASAVLIELFRRRAAKLGRISSEWHTVNEIAREKELDEEEQKMLRHIIERWAPDIPLKVTTVHQEFDDCVEKEMNSRSTARPKEEWENVGFVLRELRVKLGHDYIAMGQAIKSTRQLREGQHVWVLPKSENSRKWMKVQVAAIDEACFTLLPTLESGAESGVVVPSFRPGDKVRCRIWREYDARYAYDVTFMRVDKDTSGWVFEHISDLERTQDRKHYRVRHEQATIIGVLNASVDGKTGDVKTRRAITKTKGRISTLSAGGVSLVVDTPVPKQVLLRIEIKLPGAPFSVETEVIDSTAITGERYFVRARFVEIDDALRDRIAKYIMKCQQRTAAVEAEKTESKGK